MEKTRSTNKQKLGIFKILEPIVELHIGHVVNMLINTLY